MKNTYDIPYKQGTNCPKDLSLIGYFKRVVNELRHPNEAKDIITVIDRELKSGHWSGTSHYNSLIKLKLRAIQYKDSYVQLVCYNRSYTFRKVELESIVQMEFNRSLDDFLDSYVWDDVVYIKDISKF